jgi:PKD repeat protein
MRRSNYGVLVGIVLLLSAGCGGSNSTPASPSPPAAGGVTDLAARLDVKGDALGSRDPVSMLSEVVADASASTGSGPLTFSIDFGDGTVASTATAKHVYAAAGAFTITATVSDAQGHKATAVQPITVKTVAGSWFEAEYVQRATRVEVRRLTVSEQTGTTIRGVYRVTGAADRPFTGTLTSPRHVRITIADGATLDGVLPGRLDDANETWVLQARGDDVDGERLEFRPIVGDPTGPAPDADFVLSTGGSDAWGAYAALTPVRIDASLSRGTDLAYFIEFGDGFVATGAQAAHVVDPPVAGPAHGRVTVVDRFGRSDTEPADYVVFELGFHPVRFLDDYWINSGNGPPFLAVEFLNRSGLSYGGEVAFHRGAPDEVRTAAVATLSDGPHIRIVLPDAGIELEGSIRMLPGFNAVMTLVQRGGPDAGKTWVLNLTSRF